MKKLELWEELGREIRIIDEDEIQKVFTGFGFPNIYFFRFNNIKENVKEIAEKLNKEDFTEDEEEIEDEEKVEWKAKKIKAKIKEITGLDADIEYAFKIDSLDENLFLYDTEESVLGFLQEDDDFSKYKKGKFFDFLEFPYSSERCFEYFCSENWRKELIIEGHGVDVYKLEVSDNSVELDNGCVRKIFTIDGEKVEGEYLFIASNDYKIINRERLIECLEHLKQESCEEVDIEEYLELIDELK